MLSSSFRASLKAQSNVTVTRLGLLPRALCPALLQRNHTSQLGLASLIQRRDYAALNRKDSNSDHARRTKPVEKDEQSSLMSLRSARRELKDAYKTPTMGFISYLPKSWIPYAELVRLDKPTGTLYLWFPCAFSTILAASMTSPVVSNLDVQATAALFLAGAFVMRGAGCTVNDLWDRNLDPYVERTKFRPIARGAITPVQATTFLGAQLLLGLAILLQFPTTCLYYGIPSLLLVGIYPLAKRFTNYPQFVLGLTFSWGAMMGFPAMGIDLLSDTNALYTAACLYLSCVTWTVNYDMVYAHMDIKDDVKAGIKSIARAHEHNTKTVLHGLAAAQAVLLGASGYFAGAVWYLPWMYGAVVYGLQSILIGAVDLKSVKSCLKYFKASAGVIGSSILLGLLANHANQERKEKKAAHSLTQVSKDSNDEPVLAGEMG